MNIVDFLFTSDLKLGELLSLLSLFLQGYDDKVYIYLYNGDDSDIIFDNIRILDPSLNKYLNRKIIGLELGETLGVYLEREEEGKNNE